MCCLLISCLLETIQWINLQGTEDPVCLWWALWTVLFLPCIDTDMKWIEWFVLVIIRVILLIRNLSPQSIWSIKQNITLAWKVHLKGTVVATVCLSLPIKIELWNQGILATGRSYRPGMDRSFAHVCFETGWLFSVVTSLKWNNAFLPTPSLFFLYGLLEPM